jgi:DhnA family fructose-bisphosphate aldolase class Ia
VDREAIGRLADKFATADGLLLSPSMMLGAQDVLARRDRPTLFLLQEWQSVSRPAELLGYEEGATAPLISVEEAARWGADGVMSYLYVGWRDPQREALEVGRVAETSRACQEFALLHLVESRAVREEVGPTGLARPDLVRYHTRLAAELGADLVKTKWTGADTFGTVVEGCPVPVLLAGGSRTRDLEEVLADAREMVAAGARGLVWGRQIFQHPDPRAALERVLEVVHSGLPSAP